MKNAFVIGNDEAITYANVYAVEMKTISFCHAQSAPKIMLYTHFILINIIKLLRQCTDSVIITLNIRAR